MKLGLYMYDDPINLDEGSTAEFLKRYDMAKDVMNELLGLFSDEDNGSREAIFFMLGLRTLIDDFLEFCTTGIPVELIERLLNGDLDAEEEIFHAVEAEYSEQLDEDDDDFEILVEFDDDEEE